MNTKTAASNKIESLLTLSAVALALLWVNLLAQGGPARFDLTEEKRFTLANGTVKVLENLDDVVYVEVFLEGDLNAGFKRLRNSVRETLEEFRAIAGKNVQFTFTNPDEQPNETAKQRYYQELAQKGIPPTTLYDNIDGKRSQKLIFPGAILSYKGKETPISLLKGQKTASPQEQLNQSAEGAEYAFVAAIKKLSTGPKKRVAILQGHGELKPEETADLEMSLRDFYQVERLSLERSDLSGIDALIVAQPKGKFSDLDKFKIDQYIMKGGKALFFVDAIQMNLDSISKGGTYAFAYDLDLTEMFFKYGFRLNDNLVQDFQAGVLEVVTGMVGERPNVQRLPWPYHAFVNNYAKHPVVRNLDAVQFKFFGTIDTLPAEGIQKTPLMFTSQYSRIKNAPTLVDLNELKADLDQSRYTLKHLPVAYLLEGTFNSAYAARFAPAGATEKNIIKKGQPAKILICSDGDLPRNEIDPKTKKPLPLGFDKNAQQTFGHKDFILNALEYMIDEEGIISSRSKEVRLRPLDKALAQEERGYWQTFNLLLPLLGVALFGIGRYFWRKKKYES